MIVTAVILLQAAGGLGSVPPAGDEQLRFIFPAASVAGDAKISGTAATPVERSGSAFYRLVRQCGGKGLAVEVNTARYTVVSARSSANNLAVAQCVRQSTAARFSVGVRTLDFKGFRQLDQQPFVGLWDRQLASNGRTP